jgi:very-short-patch-repair endonuclease
MCGRDYESNRLKKYCSFSCQQKAFKKKFKEQNNPAIICCVCGKETHNSKYCSRRCVCIAMNRPGVHKSRKGINHFGIPWNKGLTKDDLRVSTSIDKGRETQKRKYANGELTAGGCFVKGNPAWNKGLTKKDARVAKYSKETGSRMARLWKEPAFVQKQMVARGVRPNNAELALEQKLARFGFRYVGDGQIIIAGKCPDYCDDKNHLIELYGDYWHKGQNPKNRIDLFKQFGYDTMIIWEHEIADNLDSRIINFIQLGGRDEK